MSESLKIFYSSTGFSITVLIFMIVFKVIYHRKKKDGVKTSPIFQFLMNLVFFPLILEILASSFYAFVPSTFAHKQLILDIISKGYLAESILWISIFIYYTISFIRKHTIESKQEESTRYRYMVYTLAMIICFVSAIILPYKVNTSSGAYIIRGTLYNIMQLEFLVSSTILYMMLIIYRKKMPNLKLVPFLIIFALYFILSIIEIKFGYICNNLTSFFGLLISVIYFTTESQDKMIVDNYTELKDKENAVNNTKKKMLINMSHEIRTPMHALIGYTDILLRDNISKDEYKENSENILYNALKVKDTIEISKT